jgi:uracil-DNA glycosylase family 4
MPSENLGLNYPALDNENCIKCGRCNTTSKPFIPARGDEECDILLVGQHPNYDENKKGIAFVGDYSNYLQGMIGRLGLSEYKIAKTLSIRCGAEKKISVKQHNLCREFSYTDIEKYKPKLVILLGAVALKTVLGLTNITNKRGTIIYQEGIPFLPTFHPGVVQDDRNNETWLINDFQQAKDFLDELYGKAKKKEKISKRYQILTKLEEVHAFTQKALDHKGPIAYDTEFEPLDIWLTEKPVCLGVSFSLEPFTGIFIPYEHAEAKWNEHELASVKECIRIILTSKKLIVHNAEADVAVALRCFGLNYADINIVFDTMRASMAIHGPKSSHRLKNLAFSFADTGGYDEDVEKFKAENKILTYGDIPLKILGAPYAAGDTDTTAQIARALSPKIAKMGQKKFYYDVLLPSHRLNLAMRKRGLLLDWDEWQWRYKHFSDEKVRLLDTLECLPAVQEFADAIRAQKKKFSLKSGPQMRALLFTVLGVQPSGIKTETKLDALNAPAVKLMLLQDGLSDDAKSVLSSMLKFAKATTFRGTFLNGVANNLYEDGYLHSNFHNFTESCRRGSRNPNVQNLPGGDPLWKGDPAKDPFNMRMLVKARDGYTFVAPDYCVYPTMRILKTSLEWVPAEDIKIGDELIGFDEKLKGAKTKKSVVEKIKKLKKPCYKITTSQGEVICSDDHMWVGRESNKPGKIRKWIKTKDLKIGNTISYYVKPWEFNNSREAGYLSGFFDGEGYVSKTSLGFGQNKGETLDYVLQLIDKFGFKANEITGSTKKCRRFHMAGNYAGMRFIGSIRPQRLLNKYQWENKRTWSHASPVAEIVSIEYLGEQDVIAIQTSTKTMIVEGMYSHNCQLEFRLAACYSKDANMVSGCLRPKPHDAHTRVANKFNIFRDYAKIVNFLIIYGGSWKKLQATIFDKTGEIWTETFSKSVRNGMVEEYMDLFDTIRDYHDFIKVNKYVTTPFFGHVRLLPDVDSKEEKIRAKSLREGWNHVVQSLGHDLLEVVMQRLFNFIEKENLDWWLADDLHDGFLLEVPEGEERDAAKVCEAFMAAIPKEILQDWMVAPIMAEVKSGKYFGNLKELK